MFSEIGMTPPPKCVPRWECCPNPHVSPFFSLQCFSIHVSFRGFLPFLAPPGSPLVNLEETVGSGRPALSANRPLRPPPLHTHGKPFIRPFPPQNFPGSFEGPYSARIDLLRTACRSKLAGHHRAPFPPSASLGPFSRSVCLFLHFPIVGTVQSIIGASPDFIRYVSPT